MTKIITTLNDVLIGSTDNPNLTFDQLRTIKEVNGAVCYEVTDEQYNQAQSGWDLSFVNGSPVFTKGDNATTIEQNNVAIFNDFIYKQIGELVIIKNGKLAVGTDVANEENKIARLQSQLK